MTKYAPSNTMARAKRLHQNWAESDLSLASDDLNLQIFAGQIADVDTKDVEILAAEAHLKALREGRREDRKIVHHSTKRVMNLAKGRFGDDSSVYKLFGGIPTSERARPGARPKRDKAV